MENIHSSSKKKLLSIREEKSLREADYISFKKRLHNIKTPVILDLEILPKGTSSIQTSQRVLVSIKPKHRVPEIKTLYIADKSRSKRSNKSGSRFGLGDHSTVTTRYSEDNIFAINPEELDIKPESNLATDSSATDQVATTTTSKCSQAISPHTLYNANKRSAEKCYMYTQPHLAMKCDAKADEVKTKSNKVDVGTSIYTNTTSEEIPILFPNTINKLKARLDYLEHRILKQEILFRSMNPNLPLSSSDENFNENTMRATSSAGRPGCSYIDQYSHIPEGSAFQRYVQQTAPLSSSKATTLEKEHNSEQYSRNFVTYDGITGRGRRQCASVPCKRDDIPKMAAERVHKIRHKLNPVRDYRLMDTVHYLAQGEFAPRDDGIKLTPSREAVLSDIIWEDVCRTHWPSTRLGHRVPERYSTRCELQRLIDNLLRERVAHVERRRRRHYRIVKLNHRHESCRPVGKTGDIIVASHKNRDDSDEKAVTISDHNEASAIMSERRWKERSSRRTPKSHDRFMFLERKNSRRHRPDDSVPGPSCSIPRSSANRDPTCCYHTSNHVNVKTDKTNDQEVRHQNNSIQNLTSGSSLSTYKQKKKPRLVVKKEPSYRKHMSKEGPDLEHYILLPTLVVKTPSNTRRQKKFSELYHRILNVQHSNGKQEPGPPINFATSSEEHQKKDIGFNIDITVSNSSDT